MKCSKNNTRLKISLQQPYKSSVYQKNPTYRDFSDNLVEKRKFLRGRDIG